MELYHALYITNYFIKRSIYPTNFIYYVYNTLQIPHYNRGKYIYNKYISMIIDYYLTT